MNLKALFDKNALNVHPYHALLNMKLPKNLMFLYSDGDALCNAEDIAKFEEEMKRNGYDARGKRWKDSQHVEHYRKYPVEYEKLCLDFVRSAC